MEVSEKMIEDLIVKAIQEHDLYKLYERGLYSVCDYDKFYRQLDLGSYGRLDLVGLSFSRDEQLRKCKKIVNVGVVEIKKDEINSDTFFQAIRYCKGIEQLLKGYNLTANFTVTLIGTSVRKNDFIYLPDYFKALKLYTVNIHLEKGVTFKQHANYCLSETRPFNTKPEIINDVREYLRVKVKSQYAELLYENCR